MPNTPKKLFIGTPGTVNATLYTVPASTTTIIKNIVLTNVTNTPAKVTITVGGKDLISGYSVNGNDAVVIDMSLILNATDIIQGVQVTSNAINLFISGVEVS